MRLEIAKRSIIVNVATRAALVARVEERFARHEGFALATVNLDHLGKLRTDAAFARAYDAQDFVVADGNPIVWLSRIAGQPVELLPGSDLVVPLCELAAKNGVRVGLVGSHDKALNDAREALCRRVPGLDVAYLNAPPYGFDPQGGAAETILQDLEAQEIGLCFLALGAPKQEVLAARGRQVAPHVGFASIGAGLDFLGGHQVRAPRWMRRFALEWLWRLLQSPRRLAGRYALSFAILPGLMLRARRQR